jgi:hypothetical protein
MEKQLSENKLIWYTVPLELRERQTKTKTGSNIKYVREVNPKIHPNP